MTVRLWLCGARNPSNKLDRTMVILNDLFFDRPESLTDARKNAKDEIGRGTQGAIFAVDKRLPGVVLKVLKEAAPSRQHDAILDMIRWAKRLDPDVTSHFILLDRLNLPLRTVVTESGTMKAIYLPEIPSECKATAYEPSPRGQKPSSRKINFQAQYLIADKSPVGPITQHLRWQALVSLAETLACMHSSGLVHGDLSLNNVLCKRAQNEDLSVYLIDCTDGFIIGPKRSSYQVIRKSDRMYDPFSSAKHQISAETDVFVLAWWIVSVLGGASTDPGSEQNRSAGIQRIRGKVPSEVMALVKQSLGPLGSRPNAVDVLRPLNNGLEARTGSVSVNARIKG